MRQNHSGALRSVMIDLVFRFGLNKSRQAVAMLINPHDGRIAGQLNLKPLGIIHQIGRAHV